MFCHHCGTKIAHEAAFCPACGTHVTHSALNSNADTKRLNGWSSVYNDPTILAAAQKNKKSAFGCAWILTLLFPVGFLIAGIFVDELPLIEAAVIGVGLGLLMLIINMLRIRSMRKPVWEGAIIKKYKKDKQEYDKEDNVSYYTDFILIIQKNNGKKVRIARKNSRELYDYFAVGDRVRFHPAFGTYEKYDKSKDKIIYCNVCSMMNPITEDRCKRCSNLLFK